MSELSLPARADAPLHDAAARHAWEALRRLIAEGAPVHARDRQGACPLHHAARLAPAASAAQIRRQRQTLEVLLQAGADPDARDRRGNTALHQAARCRASAAAKLLLAAGADPRLANRSGSTPLHLAVQVSSIKGSGSMAMRYQQRGIIRLLLRHGARVSDQNGAGRSVLECARSPWLQALLGQDLS